MKNGINLENPQLAGESLLAEGSERIGILFIHGFTATTVEVRKLAEFFKAKGFSISAPLLPGHGTTPEDLNATKYTEWIECVEKAYDYLRQRNEKVLVAGESMGAVLCLFLAEHHPEIAALYLFSTALIIRRRQYAKYIKYFRPIIDKNLPEDGLPWQGYSVYPMRAAHEFDKLAKITKRSLNKILSPTLLFQGVYDRTIDPENLDFIFSRIGPQYKEKVILQNSGHVMLLNQELDLIQSKIDDFNIRNQIF